MYQLKPIDAMYVFYNFREVVEWANCDEVSIGYTNENRDGQFVNQANSVVVPVLLSDGKIGRVHVKSGNWIIKAPKSLFIVMDDETFKFSYEWKDNYGRSS